MTSFKAAYKLELRSPGRTFRNRGFRPSHSFVQQFVQLLRAQFNQADEANVRDILNTLRTVDWDAALQRLAFDAGAGVWVWGPQIGTDDTAEAVDDHALGAPIEHGGGAGEMDFAATTIAAIAVVADDVRCDISRTFTNNSGNTITVKEVGLTSYSGVYNFLCIRDLPSPTYEVPNGGVLTLTYRIYTTN